MSEKNNLTESGQQKQPDLERAGEKLLDALYGPYWREKSDDGSVATLVLRPKRP